MPNFWELTATEIALAVRSREVSAEDVTRSHLDRITSINSKINAVVQECPEEAIQAAQAVDDAITRGEEPGVLCGVPVTIKVNVDQKGHATTNGLKLLQNQVAQYDSPVVSNIRKAGGVIVGRTNTPAFSLRWFTKNDLHGQTLNPRNRAITPGGSSGGAAAAVAAGLCAVGHGTDIAGSIRYPAYACGLHGLRPSLGRVPAFNASAPERYIGAQLMAVSGPIARSISDLKISMAAMAMEERRDPWYCAAPMSDRPFPKRVAMTIVPDGMPVTEDVRGALSDASEKLWAAGWTVEEVDCPPLRRAAEINAVLWMAETQFGAADMIAREDEADSQFVFAIMSEAIGEISFERLMEALQIRASLIREWELFLQKYPILLCPVSGALPFMQQQDISSKDAFLSILEDQLTQRALPTLGVPSLSVATGAANGRPVGVQLVGPRFREDILLAAGADLEAAYGAPQVATPEWD